MPEQISRRYHSYTSQRAAMKNFEKDREKLAEDGWRVVSAIPEQYNGLLIHKQHVILVVYERD